MSKIYILFLFLPIIGLSQPVITDNILPEFGSEYEARYFENINFDPGPAGENQVWDFSDLEGGFDFNFKILDPATTPESDKFPDATFVWNFVEFEIFIYYLVTEDSLSQMGNAVATTEETTFLVLNSDLEDALQFPVTYGSSYSYDTKYQNFLFGNLIFEGERTATLTADGYGTLITPFGTFENTLRIKIINNEFGINNTQYSWLSEDNFVPLLVYEFSDDGEVAPSLYYSNLSTTVSTDDKSFETEISFQYDDMNEVLLINTKGQDIQNFRVFDFQGRLVESFGQQRTENHLELVLTKPLNHGMYILNYIQNGIMKSKSFVAGQ